MKYILFLSLLILLSCIQDKSPTIKVINISGIPYDFNRDPSTEINDVLFINDTIGFLAGNFNDLQHVDDNKNIFATSEYNAFIYKTIDGGKTFNKLPSFGNGKIQYLSQCKDELFAVKIVENLGDKYKSIIYHSTDEGESWEAILERDDYINRLKHFSDFSFFVVWNSNEGKNSLYVSTRPSTSCLFIGSSIALDKNIINYGKAQRNVWACFAMAGKWNESDSVLSDT